MRCRFDLHLHSWFSSDAVSRPEDAIAAARARGLSGIAVTDHDCCDVTAYLREKGFAREDGQAVDDFLLIPGVEVSTAEGHLLCLGVVLPDMTHAPAVEVCEAVHAQGGIAIAAHPFDHFRAGIRREVLDALPLDGIEVFNAAVTLRSFNRDALTYARERNLPGTASSDAHHPEAIGTACTILELQHLDVASALEAIRKGPEREERYLTFWEGLKKHACNWVRFFNPSPQTHFADGAR